MPIIKRYPNRKLYNTEAKQYVTLEHISQMIQAGEEISVVDHESGEDLTTLTLSQIILEQEKKSAGFLPRSLLTSLIRTGGDTLEHVRQSVVDGTTDLSEMVGHLIQQGKLTAAQAQELLGVDARVADVLHTLNMPSHSEIKQLQAQVSDLNAKLEALLAESAESGPQTVSPAPLPKQENSQKNSNE